MDTDPVTMLTALGLGHYASGIILWFCLIGYAVTWLAKRMAPPAQNCGWYATLYGVINEIAHNSGHAANATAPGAVKPVFVPIDPDAATLGSASAVSKAAQVMMVGLLLSLVACGAQPIPASTATPAPIPALKITPAQVIAGLQGLSSGIGTVASLVSTIDPRALSAVQAQQIGSVATAASTAIGKIDVAALGNGDITTLAAANTAINTFATTACPVLSAAALALPSNQELQVASVACGGVAAALPLLELQVDAILAPPAS